MRYIPLIRIQVIREGSVASKEPLTNPTAVYDFIKAHLEDKDREYFVALFLDIKNKVIAVHHVAIGTLDTALITPRELFKAAILVNAYSVLVAHNHPSGDPAPSTNDIEVTRSLAEAGKILGIQVLDHIIIGEQGVVSFREKGLLDKSI